MSDAYNPPSVNPADEDSLTGAFRLVLEKFAQSLDDCLPALVIAYDRDRNRATVQPQIMMGTTGGDKISRAQIAEVPVLNLGGGGFILSFPINPGDLGWIKASDRDISLFLQGLAEEWPNTKRVHSFADGLFIPDAMRAWTLNGDDQARVVLQSTDGLTRVAVGADTIAMTASASVTIDAPTVTITGDLQVDGAANADGGVTGAGIVLETHTHGGVQTGGGNTLEPNP